MAAVMASTTALPTGTVTFLFADEQPSATTGLREGVRGLWAGQPGEQAVNRVFEGALAGWGYA